MSDTQEALRAAILERGVTLPSLPAVAARVAEAMRQGDVTSKQIADELAADPALAARVMRVANSSLYRAEGRIDRLDLAVTRIGLDTTRRLVMAFALKLASQKSPLIVRHRITALWTRSVEVATIARVLGRGVFGLNPEEAMLAGLLHRIGELPLLSVVSTMPQLLRQPERLDAAIDAEQAKVGAVLLRSWGFPDEIADVPVQVADLTRSHSGRADYGDVVTVARLYALTEAEAGVSVDYATVPAFAMLGLAPERESVELDEHELDEARALMQ
ncbi:HDOD domain-containing protein [Fontimonas sp. SYSU GA230001]|uniref:HDOD domain-containing protein n=1 Tax=Fontimonas sp. SYSU GA230001 TaxID=3142450 RepID=UPI0032B4EF21